MKPAKSGVRGYAFLILMMMVTILLISLTAALPSIYAEGQREKEEELIFRGNEYARAILLFRRKFGRFPTSVDELVKKTNGLRFLRHPYKDPMTRDGKWRFIHANAAGMLIDSKAAPTMGGPGGANPPNSANPPGSQGFQLGPGLQSSSNTSRFGGSSTSSSTGTDSGATSGTGTSSSSSSGSTTGASTSGTEMKGAYIAGVASTSHKPSFRLYDNHSHYDEWEFLGIDQSANAPGGTGSQQTTTPTGPSQPTGQNPGPATGPGAPSTPPPSPPENPPE